ncbi:MAG: lysine--tRNA ligase, partial [Candidatus Aenigmarchaeota archaeon]|nr:lysine--tRNA ligase [Candidatus Aenigmarchaeota archaeon]
PETFQIKSSTSISGVPHIGNASDVIRHDAVVRSLRNMGKKVHFIWVSEDMDPLRKVPAGIPKKFSKYLGMPVSSLPCPVGCCENYVKHFTRLFIKSLHEHFGTEPELISTTDSYKDGGFYPYIKLAFEKTDIIRGILNKNRTNPLPKVWSPWKPVCDNCGKLITTKVIDLDGDIVKYECKDYSFKEFGQEAYTKVEGCGHKGDSDIKKGNGKLLWKIEWAAEWPLWKINFEGAGKEHYMPGGSFWNAGEICERVYNWPEPYPGENEIQPYEYILVSGEKMSASKGNVVATWEWPEFAPPEILRMLLIKRPNKTRGFSYEKIPEMVDEFDELKEIYYDHKEIENDKELRNLKKLYENSITEKENHYIPNVSFGYLSLMSQMIPEATAENFEKVIEILTKTGHLDKVNDKIKMKVLDRIKKAERWMEKYGPDDEKIELLPKVPAEIIDKLSKEQKLSLEELSNSIKKDLARKDLWNEIKSIAEKNQVKPGKIFQAAYLVLLGKKRGPRLIPFIELLDKDFVISRFKLEN